MTTDTTTPVAEQEVVAVPVTKQVPAASLAAVESAEASVSSTGKRAFDEIQTRAYTIHDFAEEVEDEEDEDYKEEEALEEDQESDEDASEEEEEEVEGEEAEADQEVSIEGEPALVQEDEEDITVEELTAIVKEAALDGTNFELESKILRGGKKISVLSSEEASAKIQELLAQVPKEDESVAKENETTVA